MYAEMWSVEILGPDVAEELDALPADLRARFEHIVNLIAELIELALRRGGDRMSKRKIMPAEELFSRWRKEPAYNKAFEALVEEYAIAAALIAARSHAGLTQAELAARIGTTQSAVARMESGRGRPSTRTLEKVAEATGTRLRVKFEPKGRAA
jgi:DNA-binding XRE family transcriptional regulator